MIIEQVQKAFKFFRLFAEILLGVGWVLIILLVINVILSYFFGYFEQLSFKGAFTLSIKTFFLEIIYLLHPKLFGEILFI